MERSIEGLAEFSKSDNAESLQQIAAVESAVARLPELYRIPVLLHYTQGLSYEQTAEVVGCAAGTVGSRLAAARDKIRELLAAAGLASIAPSWELLLKSTAAAPAPPALKIKLQMVAATAAPARMIAGIATAAALAAAAASIAAAVILASPIPPAADAVASAHAIATLQPTVDIIIAASAPGVRERVDAAPTGAPSAVAAPPAPFEFKVSGIVRSAADRKPVAGAIVGLERIWPPKEYAQVKGMTNCALVTAEDGAFDLTDRCPDPSIFILIVYGDSQHPFHAPDRVFEVSSRREETAEPLVRAATPEENEALQSAPRLELMSLLQKRFEAEKLPFLEGVVRREDGGALPRDIDLRAIDADGDAFRPFCEFDPRSGRFLMGSLKTGNMSIEALAGPGGHAVLKNITIHDGNFTAGIVMTLRSGNASVRGRVEDLAGRPVAQLKITAVPEDVAEAGLYVNPAAEATTDANGRFELKNAGTAGESLRIAAEGADYIHKTIHQIAAGTDSLQITVCPRPIVRGTIASTRDLSRGISIQITSVREFRRFKGPVQVAFMGANFHPATGRFDQTVSELGRARITIGLSTGETVYEREFDVPEEGVDLGAIEIK